MCDTENSAPLVRADARDEENPASSSTTCCPSSSPDLGKCEAAGSDCTVEQGGEAAGNGVGTTEDACNVEEAVSKSVTLIVPSISQSEENLLRGVMKNGFVQHPWMEVKEILSTRALHILNGFESVYGFEVSKDEKTYEERRDEALAALNGFNRPPFTIQRITEVIMEPRAQYSSTHKLLNGLEKLLSVTTTLPPYQPGPEKQKQQLEPMSIES